MGGTQISRGLSTDCRGRYGGPGCSQTPAPGASLTLEQTRPVSGQGTGEAAWALPAVNHGQMVRRLVRAMLHLLSATLPPSVLPLCPGLITLALAWLATAQVPALSEPESPHFSPPAPAGSRRRHLGHSLEASGGGGSDS